MHQCTIRSRGLALDSVLLVEGVTPANFFEAFAKRMGVDARVEIRSYKSITELGKYLRAIASTTEFKVKVKRLGITRDAEGDAGAALNSADHAIKSAKLEAGVQTRIEILPDNVTIGMIETLCLRAFATNPVLQSVDAFLSQAEQMGASIPTGPKRDKHRAQILLAVHEGPEPYVGLAARKGIIPFDHIAFDRLRELMTFLCP